MPTTQTVDLDAAARRHQALADPTRLQIMETLAGGERCVCELTAALKAGQSRLSFHLKALREAGFLRARRAGRWMYYSIDPEGVARTRTYLEELTERAQNGVSGLEGCGPDETCCG